MQTKFKNLLKLVEKVIVTNNKCIVVVTMKSVTQTTKKIILIFLDIFLS